MTAAVSVSDGRTLRGGVVRLDLLVEDDAAGLLRCFTDPAAYACGYTMHAPPSDLAETRALLRRRFLVGQGLADGRGGGRTAYAVRLAADSELGPSGTLVGTSSLLEADLGNESVHLGSTFYGPRWWGTAVNPDAKLLLLAHAFDGCGFGRLKIQTDALNTRSQDAIARLGAVREGVLRRHTRREDGTFRDTVVFSVLRAEWPSVRAGLEDRLRSAGGPARS